MRPFPRRTRRLTDEDGARPPLPSDRNGLMPPQTTACADNSRGLTAKRAKKMARIIALRETKPSCPLPAGARRDQMISLRINIRRHRGGTGRRDIGSARVATTACEPGTRRIGTLPFASPETTTGTLRSYDRFTETSVPCAGERNLFASGCSPHDGLDRGWRRDDRHAPCRIERAEARRAHSDLAATSSRARPRTRINHRRNSSGRPTRARVPE